MTATLIWVASLEGRGHDDYAHSHRNQNARSLLSCGEDVASESSGFALHPHDYVSGRFVTFQWKKDATFQPARTLGADLRRE